MLLAVLDKHAVSIHLYVLSNIYLVTHEIITTKLLLH